MSICLGLSPLVVPAQSAAFAGSTLEPGGSTFLRHFNAGVTSSGAHDSSTGWYDVVTPVVTYDFSQRYSADASMSFYPYRYALTEQARTATTQLTYDGGAVGDMLLEAHAIFDMKGIRSISTTAVTLPTGKRADGLGTGRATFSLDNRFERYFGQTGLIVDLGGGDSSALESRLVTREYTSLGPLAQFQAGFATWLPNSISIQSVAYEELPVGDQKTYTMLPSRLGFPTRSVVTGRKVIEDNGFTTTLSLPLSSQWTLESSYNRSLRFHLDTVSTGVTFMWKGFPLRHREALIDRAMRAAEAAEAVH